MRIVTLLTDFGSRDGFVGVMKGILWSRAPHCQVVDLTHEIEPGDIRSAAFVLFNVHRWFPPGTVHVAVVDPGVGSPRPALAVRTARAWYVGPDNGVLSWALRGQKLRTIRRIENKALFLHPVSQTFHGRDVFAPVAAYLAGGGHAEKLGPVAHEWQQIPWPEPIQHDNTWRGEILYVDRFGNALTNLPHSLPGWNRPFLFLVRGKKTVRFPAGRFYAEVPRGKPIAVPGSSGFWELALHGDSAARRFGLAPGDPVHLVPAHKGM